MTDQEIVDKVKVRMNKNGYEWELKFWQSQPYVEKVLVRYVRWLEKEKCDNRIRGVFMGIREGLGKEKL